MSATNGVNVNDLPPGHPDSNFCGKQDFLKEIEALKQQALKCETKEDVEAIDAAIDSLDDKWDFAFWSGRGGDGDDPHIFPALDEVVLIALRYSDKHDLGCEVMGYECAVDYEEMLTGEDTYAKELHAEIENMNARREMIESKLDINLNYSHHLVHVLRFFINEYKNFSNEELEALTKDEIRSHTIIICVTKIKFYTDKLKEDALDMNKYDTISDALKHVKHFRAVYRTLKAGH